MTAFAAVLLYAAWAMLLTILYAFPRVPQVFFGGKPSDYWERNQPNRDPALLQRAKAAHLNCLENFPLFAAVVVIAALMQKTAVTDALAAWVLYARIGQSVTHLLGVQLPLLLLRATLFLTQIGLTLWMIASLLR